MVLNLVKVLAVWVMLLVGSAAGAQTLDGGEALAPDAGPDIVDAGPAAPPIVRIAEPQAAAASPRPEKRMAELPTSEPVADSPARSKPEGVIPNVLFGPKVGLSLVTPPIVMLGLDVKVFGYLGLSFDYGLLPRGILYDDYDLESSVWNVGVRAFPFKGAFYVGLVFGHYELHFDSYNRGTRRDAINDFESFTLGPQLGWKWVLDSGLTFGLSLGYGFNLDYSSTTQGGGDSTSTKKTVDTYIGVGVPIITAFEIGWLF